MDLFYGLALLVCVCGLFSDDIVDIIKAIKEKPNDRQPEEEEKDDN